MGWPTGNLIPCQSAASPVPTQRLKIPTKSQKTGRQTESGWHWKFQQNFKPGTIMWWVHVKHLQIRWRACREAVFLLNSSSSAKQKYFTLGLQLLRHEGDPHLFPMYLSTLEVDLSMKIRVSRSKYWQVWIWQIFQIFKSHMCVYFCSFSLKFNDSAGLSLR